MKKIKCSKFFGKRDTADPYIRRRLSVNELFVDYDELDFESDFDSELDGSTDGEISEEKNDISVVSPVSCDFLPFSSIKEAIDSVPANSAAAEIDSCDATPMTTMKTEPSCDIERPASSNNTVNDPIIDSAPVVDTAKETIINELPTINSMFGLKGYTIVSASAEPEYLPVEELANKMATEYEYCAGFYKVVKSVICDKASERKGYFSRIKTRSETEWRHICNMANEFLRYGIFIKLYIEKDNSILFTVTSAPKVLNFLMGKYLENHADSVARKVVEKVARDTSCTDYEIMSNVIIEGKHNNRHELDLVIRMGNSLFWAEVKSGNYYDTNIDKYRILGTEIGVNPNCHILLHAEADTQQCTVLSYFYECFIANIMTYETQLELMLREGLHDKDTILL